MEPKTLLENSREALTFDDISIVPAASSILPEAIDVRTKITKNIVLNIPLVSAAMDTVTEARLAIAIAQQGGIGIIHRNCPIEEQVKQVDLVKRYESGMITNPITLPPAETINTAKRMMEEYHISGIPIIENDKLKGILTNRDLRFEKDLTKKIGDLMTTDLITVPEGTTLEEAKEILHKHRIEKLPVIDKENNLKGLITFKDIQKKIENPLACKDEKDRLMVGAAIGPFDDDRVKALIKANVDLLVLDTAHGHSENVVKAIKRIKENYNIEIIAGNVVTAEAVKDLIEAGVDGIKVGIGCGSTCTTRVIAGIGVPQITAVYNCAKEADKYGIPITADGGVKYSGDITKALAAGASAVMIGNLFAGAEESPGREIIIQGRRFKHIRGMGSVGAMKSSGRYFQSTKKVPEGIEGAVPFKGKIHDLAYQLVGGLKSGMGYAGCRTIEELRNKTEFIKVSKASLKESHPHDIFITEEAPNYFADDENFK